MKFSRITVLTAMAMLVLAFAVAAMTQTQQSPSATKTEAKQEMTKEKAQATQEKKMEASQTEQKQAVLQIKEMVPGKNIFETAMEAPDLKTFVSSIEAAGLAETLKGKEQITVFAPNDSAFAKIPKEQWDAILKDKARLASILKYHIVAGKHELPALLKMKMIKAEDGKDIMLMDHGGMLMVGNSMVAKSGLNCSNGVIHIIDTVLMPPPDKKMEGMPVQKK